MPFRKYSFVSIIPLTLAGEEFIDEVWEILDINMHNILLEACDYNSPYFGEPVIVSRKHFRLKSIPCRGHRVHLPWVPW